MRTKLGLLLLICITSVAVAQSDTPRPLTSTPGNQVCNVDPARSTFRADHYRGGDVVVTVPTNDDGYPIASFESGPLAADVIKTGKVEKSLFSQNFVAPPGQDLPTATTTQIACYADGRRVAVTVPRNHAAPVSTSLRSDLPIPQAPNTDIQSGIGMGATAYLKGGVQYTYHFARVWDAHTQKAIGTWSLVHDDLVCPNGDSCWQLNPTPDS